MILNNTQLAASKNAIKSISFLQDALDVSEEAGLAPELVRAQKLSIEGRLTGIKADIDLYEHLMTEGLDGIKFTDLEALRKAPIYYRIANRLTLADFASLIETTAGMVENWENSEYTIIEVDDLETILSKLSIKINITAQFSE